MSKRNYLSAVMWVMLTAVVARAAVDVGDKPQLRLKTLDNKLITSKDMAGKIVVLEFWATWCGPCRDQVPHLREINEKYTKQGVRLISVSRDDTRGPVLPFIKQNGMSWTHVIDKEQRPELGPVFGVSGIPHAFILSPEGEVLWRGHPAGLDEPLEKAIKEHPPAPSPTAQREKALEAIAQAMKSLEDDKDYKAAYEALADVPDEAFKDPKVQPKFKPLAARFRPIGEWAEAVTKFYEENPEAKERLTKLGVQVEAKPQPAAKTTGTEAVAAQRLTLADKKREAGDDVAAYKLYQDIAKRFAGTEAGQAAADRVTNYDADAEFVKRLESGAARK